MTITVGQAMQWSPSVLNELASQWLTAGQEISDQIERAKSANDQSEDYWRAASGDAAREHIRKIGSDGWKIVDVLEAAAKAASAGADTIAFQHRIVLINIEAGQQAGFGVLDDGTMMVPASAITPALQLRHGEAAFRVLQQYANQLSSNLYEGLQQLGWADEETAEAIARAFEPLEKVPGVNPALLSGSLTGLTAEDGIADGHLLRDGKMSDEDRDRVADILSAARLTPEQIEALERGEPVQTLPQSTYDYLNNFYNSAGKEGVLDLADHLRAREQAGDAGAADGLDGLANGLLTLSNEKIGTGTSTGGYERIPPEIRDLVTYAHDYNPEGRYTDWEQHNVNRFDMVRFADLIGESNPGHQPGSEFALDLNRAAANYVEILDKPLTDYGNTEFPAYEGAPAMAGMPEAAAKLLDIGVRNEEASYALLTGVAPDGGELGFHRDSVLLPLMTHEWPDDGASAGRLVDWIREDAIVVDPSDTSQLASSTRAGEAAFGLSQVLASTHSGYDHPGPLDMSNNFDRLIDIPGPSGEGTQSIGQLNPALTQSLAGAMAPYATNLTDPSPNAAELFGTDGFGYVGPEDASRLVTILNTDSEAGAYFNGVALAQAEALDRAFAREYAPGSGMAGLGETAGRLHGLVEVGIVGATVDQNLDAQALAQEQMQRRIDSVGVSQAITAGAVGYIPGVGGMASSGVYILGDSMIRDIVDAGDGYQAGAADFSIRGESGAAGGRLSDLLTSGPRSHSMLSELVDQGRVPPGSIDEIYLNNGRLVSYSEIIENDGELDLGDRPITDKYPDLLEASGIPYNALDYYGTRFGEGYDDLRFVLNPMALSNGEGAPQFSAMLRGTISDGLPDRWRR